MHRVGAALAGRGVKGVDKTYHCGGGMLLLIYDSVIH